MTTTLFQDFDERSKEVSKYFVFLKNLEQSTTKLSIGEGSNSKVKEIDSGLLKTLKGSAFLLLYNLIEATMRSAIETIFDELRSKGISYDQIRPELKKIVIKNLKKRNPDKIFSSITAVSVDIINAGFDREDVFSGNIDGLKIRRTAKDYGFSCSTEYQKTGDGKDLFTVKENRKLLAHGLKSFTEVGREKTTDQLLEIKQKVVRYLRQILRNIEKYLFNKEYLSTGIVSTS